MVDIVSSGMQFDMSYMFGEYLQNAPYMFRNQIQDGKNDLSSTYATAESKINEGLKVIDELYQ